MALTTPMLALLNEPDNALKEYALRTLDSRVDEIWPEIADHIPLVEELYEDTEFPAHELAALLVSKVYFNLGDLDASVKFALAAGSVLDLGQKNEYVDTVTAHAIRTYVSQRQAAVDSGEVPKDDEYLTRIVESILAGSVQPSLAIGISLEARRLDLVEKMMREEDYEFVLNASIRLVDNRNFRIKVLRMLSQHLFEREKQDYVLLTKIIIILDDPELAISLFHKLEDKPAVAYQVAFDLVATASQELLEKTAQAFNTSGRRWHARIVRILSGVPTCDLEVTFLERHNHADQTVLSRTKASLDARNSLFHSAVSFQNAFLHLGTTADQFFRQNVEWLGKATHWTQFTATAALGVIHRGNLTRGQRVLQPYFAGDGGVYSKSGALYGLGLVFAGFGKEVLDQLTKNLDAESDGEDGDIVLHGACLGVSLAAMRTQNSEVYAKLREVVYTDSAVSGQAAGLAMGLVMLGSRSETAESEMLQYARDTQHEKIIRSLALGIALLNYGKEEASDKIIDTLLADQEPILRYGGCFTVALAYAGTGNNKAIRRLLHTAVADSSDDVRRAAMLGLGFIMLRNPAALPKMVDLLSESHNPHVRYGTTLAIGIACAGTGMSAAVDVVEPMMKDPVDFVRQGAMIALAMILVQQTPAKNMRETFLNVVKDKKEDGLAKFGGALALGIIDAGGCNATITLEHKQTSNLNMKAVAGLAVFLQYWYWFPFAHFCSLAFTPTTVTCVREDLKIPDFNLICSAPAREFDYPPKLEEPNAKAPEQIVSAILSTTLKSRRKKKSGKRKEPESSQDKKEKEKTKSEEEVKEEQKKDEPQFSLPNMSRVVPWQRRFVHFPDDSRFIPMANRTEPAGVLVVSDTKPDEEITFIETQRQALSNGEDVDEAPVPAPFRIPVDVN